jgi:hypothetical protein
MYRRLAAGVAWVGVIVSSAAVLNTVVRGFSMAPGEVLSAITAAYRSLFHPIVDATVGRLLALAGIQIHDLLRDGLVIYAIGFGALMRSLEWDNAGYGFKRRVILAAFWPVIATVLLATAPFLWFSLLRHDFSDTSNWRDAAENGTLLGYATWFVIELFYIVAITGTAVLLDASGVLK